MNADSTLARLKATLPRKWFPDSSPMLDGVLGSAAAMLGLIDDLINYTKRQTRILTSEGGMLDLIAYDFFGLRFQRRSTELDEDFAPRIISEILRPRATAPRFAVLDLTGREPDIWEAPRNGDSCGYSLSSTAGYGVAGVLSSELLPGQMFVTAYRPSSSGIPEIAGYADDEGGYGPDTNNRAAYGASYMITGDVTDADIIAAVESVRPAGLKIWLQIKS